MSDYTINVDATFAFDVTANSVQEAEQQAKEALARIDPVSDFGSFNGPFSMGSWVAPARADENYPSLTAELIP